MTEKIIVRIGIPGRHSCGSHSDRSHNNDRDWLADVFEISLRRAACLTTTIRDGGIDNTSSYVDTNLDYRQLGRYTARRRSDDLANYWKYPHVHSLIKDADDEYIMCPIELRPGKRK